MGLKINWLGKHPSDVLSFYRNLLDNAHKIVEQEALNHFTESFENQGFTDTAFTPWIPRKQETDRSKGKKILQDATILMGSIHTIYIDKKTITIGTDIPYAKIHNEGGTINANIPVSKKMKKYFWYKFYATGNPKFKAAALSKQVIVNTEMPQRQFIGNSQILNNNIIKVFNLQIDKFFK